MSANLYALLKSRFPEDRSAPCLVLPGGETVSYGALEVGVGRMAALLTAKGVQPGDRVAAQTRKSPAALMLYLASLQTGAVFLPLNTAYTEAEIAYFLEDAEPKLFVQDAESLARRSRGSRAARRNPPRGARRPRRAGLHLRHHRPRKGRDAQPRQPRRERAGAGRGLGLHGR